MIDELLRKYDAAAKAAAGRDVRVDFLIKIAEMRITSAHIRNDIAAVRAIREPQFTRYADTLEAILKEIP